MSDTFVSAIANLLVDNDTNQNHSKIFTITGNDGEISFGQYSKKLYGLPGFYGDEAEAAQPSNVTSCMPCSTSLDGNNSTKCSTCPKDYRTPNNIMKVHLETIRTSVQSRLQLDANYSPRHILRNDQLLTTDLDKILLNKDIFMWFPDRLTPSFRLSMSLCMKCKNSAVKIHDVLYRSCEGFDDNGWVLYPRYRCKNVDTKGSENCGLVHCSCFENKEHVRKYVNIYTANT